MNSSVDGVFRSLPKQDRSQDLVDAILIAARRLLQSSGVAQLTTNHIATSAGVSIGSLYRYFPNKEAIVVALIEKEISGHLAALRAALEKARELSNADAVQLSVKALCDLYFDHAAFLSLLFKEAER